MNLFWNPPPHLTVDRIEHYRQQGPTRENVLWYMEGRLFSHVGSLVVEVRNHPPIVMGSTQLWLKEAMRSTLEKLVVDREIHRIKYRGEWVYSDLRAIKQPEAQQRLREIREEVQIMKSFAAVWSRWMLPGTVGRKYGRVKVELEPEEAQELMDILRTKFG